MNRDPRKTDDDGFDSSFLKLDTKIVEQDPDDDTNVADMSGRERADRMIRETESMLSRNGPETTDLMPEKDLRENDRR